MTESRERDTMRAPKDPEARLAHDVAELELALVRVGELVGKVHQTVNAIKMSQLTIEHRTHAISESKRNDRRWLVDLERRVRELEGDETAAE